MYDMVKSSSFDYVSFFLCGKCNIFNRTHQNRTGILLQNMPAMKCGNCSYKACRKNKQVRSGPTDLTDALSTPVVTTKKVNRKLCPLHPTWKETEMHILTLPHKGRSPVRYMDTTAHNVIKLMMELVWWQQTYFEAPISIGFRNTDREIEVK